MNETQNITLCFVDRHPSDRDLVINNMLWQVEEAKSCSYQDETSGSFFTGRTRNKITESSVAGWCKAS
jgi:hypothetical protein